MLSRQPVVTQQSYVVEAFCHSGAVRWRVEGAIDGTTACNCTVCRRFGALWGNDCDGHGIHVAGQTKFYSRGKEIEFHFCPRCACITDWRGQRVDEDGRRRVAVNLRLADPKAIADIPVDHFDGFDTFEDLPLDGRYVRDYRFKRDARSTHVAADAWPRGVREERRMCQRVLPAHARPRCYRKSSTYALLAGLGAELVIHTIPRKIASTIVITKPPEVRESTPLKLSFVVVDLDAVRESAKATGGALQPLDMAWTRNGERVLDGYDPKGNVVQFRDRR